MEQRGYGDQNVHKKQQHVELKHIRIHNAEQAGSCCINHKHHCGDHSSGLIGNTDISAQHIDDRCRGCYLGCNRSHHGKGNKTRKNDLCSLSVPLLKQFRNRGNTIFYADLGDPARNTGEQEHAQQIRHRSQNRLKTAGIGNTGTAHQTAAANDGSTNRSHQHQRAEGMSGDEIVTGVFDFPDRVDTDGNHCHQINTHDQKIHDTQFAVIHF